MGIEVEVEYSPLSARLIEDISTGLSNGVALAGERLLALSAARVPLNDGILQGSGSVSTPLSSRGSDPVAEVVYDTPYAARLHEHPEYNFQGGREGKYVENPALEHRDELGEIVAKAVSQMGGA